MVRIRGRRTATTVKDEQETHTQTLSKRMDWYANPRTIAMISKEPIVNALIILLLAVAYAALSLPLMVRSG